MKDRKDKDLKRRENDIVLTQPASPFADKSMEKKSEFVLKPFRTKLAKGMTPRKMEELMREI